MGVRAIRNVQRGSWSLAATAVLFAQPASGAFVIDDRSFFNGLEHTFIDFETDGDGNPLDLGLDEVRRQRMNEYASIGFVYDDRGVAWADTPPPSADFGIPPEGNIGDAHAAMGSRPVAIGPTTIQGFAIHFTTPVRAVGLGLAQKRFPASNDPNPIITSTIRAFNDAGDELGVVRFWGDLIDGQFGFVWAELDGEEWRSFTYGFMGLATSEPIARLEFEHVQNSIFDDLHFSAVPAPGAGTVFGLLGIGALVRRRRP